MVVNPKTLTCETLALILVTNTAEILTMVMKSSKQANDNGKSL